MLIPFKDLFKKYDMKVTGILHVGAHLGEERAAYRELKVPKVVWVEGNPELCRKLRRIVRDPVINAVVSDKDNEQLKFHIANNGQSSSLLDLQHHIKEHPDVHYVRDIEVSTTRLDSLYAQHDLSDLNLLNLDLQGVELKALIGLGDCIKYIDYIYTEVNKKHLYAEGALVKELDRFLTDFTRVETCWTQHGWGDALYIRKNHG